MSRYQVLRKLCGCSPITAFFIAALNSATGVRKGRAVFLNIEIEWTDTKEPS